MSAARKPKDRANQAVCRPRSKVRRGGAQSIVQALLRRQALGRKGRLPTTRGLPRGLGSLVYSMSNVIPAGRRHDRVLLGFTADGEHVAVCCGPPANPSRLELRRVRLQWPGLSRPSEDPWVFPLKLGPLCNTAPGGRAENGETAEGDNEEDAEEEGLGDLGMGMGDREPASVAVTESSDGFLVVAVVSLRYASEMQEEEDRVYRVFVAPGPSYIASVHASGELPFLGTSFTYIVPGGGGTPFPSIVVHDVGSVDSRAGSAQGHEADRLYMIVLNAVDTIHALEVRLHASGGRPPTDFAHTPAPLPPDTKFTISPGGAEGGNPGQPVVNGPGLGDRDGTARDGRAGVADADRDPLSVWWAFGRDLPSCPLISAHPLACRRPAAGGPAPTPTPRQEEQGAGAARATPVDRVGGAGTGDETAREVTPRSGVREEFADRRAGDEGGGAAGVGERAERVTGRTGRESAGGEESGGRATGRSGKEGARRGRAVASIDKSRQRVFDLEVFISKLLLRREAFPDAGKRGEADNNEAAVSAEGNGEHGAGRRCSGEARESGDTGRTNPVGVEGGGNCAGAPCRSALATDYHCVTAGLTDGGSRVLLCLVIEVVCSGAGRGSRSGGRTPEPKADGGGPELLGYVLSLDLGSGEVAVLGTKSGRGSGVPCASLCDSLARSFRRCAANRLNPSGRRISNAAVIRGRSLGALVNPIFPVAIVRGDDT